MPPVDWNPNAPAFHVTERAPGIELVARWSGAPYVYYVGTPSGCGCGFLLDGVPPGTLDYERTRAAYRSLAAYLGAHAADRGTELFACWGGDQGTEVELNGVVSVRELEEDGFALEERMRLRVEVTGSEGWPPSAVSTPVR